MINMFEGIINNESSKLIIGYHIFLHSIGVVLLAVFLYLVIFFIKKFLLERWIVKAVLVADSMFDDADLVEKKLWVMAFLKDNGLTAGLSDNMVGNLIDTEFRVQEIKKRELTSSVTVNSK